LWGIRRANDQEPVDVLVVGGQATKRHAIRSHRTTQLHPQDIRIRHGLPLTSPARTLTDIATDLRPRELEWALDEALATHIMSKAQLAEALERSQTRPGAAILRALAEQRTTPTRTRSRPEETFLRRICEAQLPLPEVNPTVHGFEVDFYWPDAGLLVEIDGYPWHSTKSAFERDHRKDAALRAKRIDVARFTADQVEDEPYAVVAAVARRLAERAATVIPWRVAVWESARRPSRPSLDGRGAAER
jgi:very-short-patch-repair endonuclease